MVDSIPVKCVSIEIKEDKLEEGALELLKVIRPEWNSADINFKLLTDGITNKLLKCFIKTNDDLKLEDPEEKQVVLVRIYGKKTDMLIDRKAETKNIILLHEENLAPALYATFKNGLAYEFVPGVTLNPKTVIQSNIYSLIAVKMAQLHLVQPKTKNGQPMLWNKLIQFYNYIPDFFSDQTKQERFESMTTINSKVKLLAEIEYLKTHLVKLGSPIVFAHNDLLLGNVIYDSQKNSVTFIDYEYADMNYQAFDIGNHFAECQGLDINSESASFFPDKPMQLDWLRIYLQVFHKTAAIDDETIEKLYIQVNKFALASHLLWGLWALVQTEHSNIDFDYLSYGKFRLEQYFSGKHQL